MKSTSAWWSALLVLGASCSSGGDNMNPTDGTPAAGETTTPGGSQQGQPSMMPGDMPMSPGGSQGAPGDVEGGGEPGMEVPGGSAGMGSEMMPIDPPSGDCAEQGLDLTDMVYSPGGNLLPHPCEPFHPTWNNPYAVLCVDAWPFYETVFPGDEYCILPPPPDKGVQFGVHPQGQQWFEQVSQGDLSGYDNPTDEFTMRPGEEEEMNYITGAPNPQAGKYYRTYVRMRAGSHHMIVYSGTDTNQERWGPGGPQLGGDNRVPGAQRPDQNTPVTLEKPAEDAGLYSSFPATPSVTFNMHHFNSTSETILKENWTNLWWEDDDASVELLPISAIDVGIFVSPGQTVDLHNQFSITQTTRVVDLFGHRHAWTPNFSAWVERSSGDTDIIYQSFDWFDQPTYRYDSIAQNPAPAPDLRTDGAATGMMTLEPGDELHFNCHIAFTDERAASEGAPSPSEVGLLVFANRAFDGEMCILFGTTAGVRMPGMQDGGASVPDFATLE